MDTPQNQMEAFLTRLKVYFLALLLFAGLALVGYAFLGVQSRTGFKWEPAMWGTGCLMIAALWIWWDYKRRSLTPEAQGERLLFDVAKRYQQVHSLEAVVEEYRASGATNETLELIRSAPLILRKRAEAKIHVGIPLLVTGLVLTGGAYLLARTAGLSHYAVAIGAIGGGVGSILDGLRQRRCFRELAR